jgi:purine-nucleoside phosphorylase
MSGFLNATELLTRVQDASGRLKQELQWEQLEKRPAIGLILGSGLGMFADQLTMRRVVPYKKIPHQKESVVAGHAGQWVYGMTAYDVPVIVAQGRVHYYEGHNLQVTTLPVRIMAALGVRNVILTNAAGSVNPEYKAGDFMLLEDQINLFFQSPLRAMADSPLGPRFVDMTNTYDVETNAALAQRCKQAKRDVHVHRGVYACLTGPQYETPAEVRMLHKWGADAVGMSTVHEAIVARQMGLTCHGISCITNLGAGLSGQALDHSEVQEMGRKRTPQFTWLLDELIRLIDER